MAKAVFRSLTASPDFQPSLNAKMDRKARVLETCHQITTGTKPWVVASDSVKANEINNAGTKVYDQHHSRTLFVQFPYRIKDKMEAKLLHSGIEAVRFIHHSKRWCYVRFRSEKLAKSALKELNKKEVKGGKLIVTEIKKYKMSNKRTPQLYKGALIGLKTQDKMEAIISRTKVQKVQDKDVSVSYSKPYAHALDLIKQKQQEINNHAEVSKDSYHNAILTSVSSPESKVNSVRKQKTVLTSEFPDKMVDTNLPLFKTEGTSRDNDDSVEDDRWNEDMEMDTQKCSGCNGEGTDNSSDDSDDLLQYKPIKLGGKDTTNSNDFSQNHISEMKHEGTETSGDDDFSRYRAIELEDERSNDDFSQYNAIKLEDEVTDTSNDESGDFLHYKAIELVGNSTETSGAGGGDGDDDDKLDKFSQYRAIELEDGISETGDEDDDLSHYKPIELEDEVTER